MKFYLFVLSLVCLGFMSCKKDRTCNCTVITEGFKVTHSKTAGNVINIPPLPPIEITPATDTTFTSPYSYSTTRKTNYNNVSKNTMNKNCATGFEEGFNDNSTNVTPGTSTVTITDSGKKKYTCKVE